MSQPSSPALNTLVLKTNKSTSGWSIYTSAFAGQTPCYTTPPLPLVPPTATASNGALVSVISNQLFALRYDLAQPKGGLSGGAKAGIAIGVIAGVVFFAALAFCIVRARKRRTQAAGSNFDQRTVGDESMADERKSTTFSNRASNNGPGDYASELASPSAPARSERNMWLSNATSPQSMTATTATQLPSPPNELPGSTFIHEHHPAYGAGYAPGDGTGVPGEAYYHTSFNGNNPSEAAQTPSVVISPVEDGAA